MKLCGKGGVRWPVGVIAMQYAPRPQPPLRGAGSLADGLITSKMKMNGSKNLPALISRPPGENLRRSHARTRRLAVPCWL